MKFVPLCSLFAMAICNYASAAPATYIIDPSHTYPSFEGDHYGISVWRGKFDKTSGTVTLDKAANAGSVDVVIDLNSVNFGLDAMTPEATGDKFFNVAKFPQATYKGKLAGYVGGVPTKVVGDLSLHGVTKPVELTINLFKCIPDFMTKRDRCGADAVGTFKRDEFGLDMGKAWGFKMDVTLRIQVEAVQEPAVAVAPVKAVKGKAKKAP